MEGEIRDCVVEGEIPQELCGSYFRNGANPQFAPGESHHVFDGDGGGQGSMDELTVSGGLAARPSPRQNIASYAASSMRDDGNQHIRPGLWCILQSYAEVQLYDRPACQIALRHRRRDRER